MQPLNCVIFLLGLAILSVTFGPFVTIAHRGTSWFISFSFQVYFLLRVNSMCENWRYILPVFRTDDGNLQWERPRKQAGRTRITQSIAYVNSTFFTQWNLISKLISNYRYSDCRIMV
jgi:hypothetical protein